MKWWRGFIISLLAFGEIVLLVLLLTSHYALRNRIAHAGADQHQTQVGTEQNQNWLDDLNTLSPAIQALSSFAVAVFTGALVVFGILGWQVAASNADAARRAAEAARDALKLNRPFLDLVPDTIIECAVGGQRHVALQAEFDVTNFGHTAARLDLVRWEISAANGATANGKVTTEAPGATIAPSQSFRLRFYTGDLSEANAHRLDDGQVILLIVEGYVVYMDQFGTNHTKHFGWMCQHTHRERPFFSMYGRNDEEEWGGEKASEEDQQRDLSKTAGLISQVRQPKRDES